MRTRRNKPSKPRFNLNHNPNKHIPETLFLIYRYRRGDDNNRSLLKYSTGVKVYPRNWDRKIQRVFKGVRLPEHDANMINERLFLLEKACHDILKEQPNISVSSFKLELDYLTGVKKRPKQKSDYTVTEYFRLYILRSNKHPRTIAKYEGARNHLIKYEEGRDLKLMFADMNAEFSERFANWLYSKQEVSQNTASKIIQTLKQVIADAFENGYHTNGLYQSSKFGVRRIKTSKHYLELFELQRLASYDLSDKKTLARVRDLWLIAAYTGLRYSDFSRLRKKHFYITDEGVELIRINTYKGKTTKLDTEVVIPVLPDLKKILQRYSYNIPEALSSQKMNLYIKEICQLADLDRMVIDRQSKSGKIVEQEIPLWTKVTNHTARYTFINVMLNDFDIAPKDLMKITGQSLKVLMGYERGDKSKNAVKVHHKTSEAILKGAKHQLKAV